RSRITSVSCGGSSSPNADARSIKASLARGAVRFVHYDFRKTFLAFPDDHLLDVVVLHYEPCGAVVQVNQAGIRILGLRALNNLGSRRGIGNLQNVGGLVLARGQTAIHD